MSTRLCSNGCQTQQETTSYRKNGFLGQGWLCDKCYRWTQPGHYRVKDEGETLTVEPDNHASVMISARRGLGAMIVLLITPAEAEEMARKLKDAAHITRNVIAEREAKRLKALKGAACQPIKDNLIATIGSYQKVVGTQSINGGLQCSHAFKGAK